MKPYTSYSQGMRQVIRNAYRRHPAPVRVTTTSRDQYNALARDGWVTVSNSTARLTDDALIEMEGRA